MQRRDRQVVLNCPTVVGAGGSRRSSQDRRRRLHRPAVLEKFLGAKSTTLSDAVSGDTATTNAVITFAAYATSIVSGEALVATTAAALWIASAVLKLKDAGIDADSIKDNAVNIIIATVMGVIAFAGRSPPCLAGRPKYMDSQDAVAATAWHARRNLPVVLNDTRRRGSRRAP